MKRDYAKFPDDESGDVLWRMLQNGDNFSKPREVDFSVIFPTEEAALDFAVVLLRNDQKVSFSEYKEHDELPWQVQVHPFMAPTHKNVVCGDPARADEFLAEFYAAEARFMAGGEGVGDALEELLGAWNSPCSVEEAMQLWRCIAMNQEILAAVGSIRARGTAVALASNQQRERARFMSKDLEYDRLFDRCFYSCELGYAKPDPEYFLSVLKLSDVLETEVLFLDDRKANVDAAKSLGIHAEHFDISEGVSVFVSILERYGVHHAQQTPAGDAQDTRA